MTIVVKADFKRAEGFQLQANLNIATDRVTALYGPSGSGKTTLLRLITGLEKINGIEVTFDDEVWQGQSVFVPPHKRGIGYVFQHLNLFPHLTVIGNLDYAEKRQHQSEGFEREEIISILDLGRLLHKYPAQLSGGEQQRVAISRALLSHPRLLVMDEPLGSIDTVAKTRILPYLQRLHDALKIPVLYISHALDEVLEFADTVLVMEGGKILSESPVVDFAVEGTGAEQPHSAAIIRCIVDSASEEHALTRVDFEGQPMYIAADKYHTGDIIRIRIPARDVSLAREQAGTSSILNILETQIEEIYDPGTGPTAVIRLSCGKQSLLARITRKSLLEMELKPGESIYSQIKGVALITDHER